MKNHEIAKKTGISKVNLSRGQWRIGIILAVTFLAAIRTVMSQAEERVGNPDFSRVLIDRYKQAMHDSGLEEGRWHYATLLARTGRTDECIQVLAALPTSERSLQTLLQLAQAVTAKDSDGALQKVVQSAALKFNGVLLQTPAKETADVDNLMTVETRNFRSASAARAGFADLALIQGLAGDTAAVARTLDTAWNFSWGRFSISSNRQSFIVDVLSRVIVKSHGELAELAVQSITNQDDNDKKLDVHNLAEIVLRCFETRQNTLASQLSLQVIAESKQHNLTSQDIQDVQTWNQILSGSHQRIKSLPTMPRIMVENRAKYRSETEYYAEDGAFLEPQQPVEDGKAIIPAIHVLRSAAAEFFVSEGSFSDYASGFLTPAVNAALTAYRNASALGRTQILASLLEFECYRAKEFVFGSPQEPILASVFLAQLSREFVRNGFFDEGIQLAQEAVCRYQTLESPGLIADIYKIWVESGTNGAAQIRDLQSKSPPHSGDHCANEDRGSQCEEIDAAESRPTLYPSRTGPGTLEGRIGKRAGATNHG